MKQLIKLQPRINQPVSEFELLHVSNKITTICLNYNSVMIQYDSIMHTYMWIYVHNSKKKKFFWLFDMSKYTLCHALINKLQTL